MAKLFDLTTFSKITGKSHYHFAMFCHQIGKYFFGYGLKANAVFENIENLPKEPCIWVSNHVHYFDWWPFRAYLVELGYPASSIVKPRPYQYTGVRWFLNTCGNIPIVSRGYIIAADFKMIIGRKPSTEEYTALNNLIRKNIPLPETDEFKKIQEGPRNILGVYFDPTKQTYGDGLRNCY